MLVPEKPEDHDDVADVFPVGEVGAPMKGHATDPEGQ